ncbi:rod shape-determining protein MreC [Brackiella oedipodis]|uniref:rod shape-determining protein MreC n=1 Tax=Brackiella oedipodis TaxID=124225 RepID=UPI0009FEC37A|nr:rod shape-determining protein MreC [Brackiella oedipodis]
MQSERSPHLFRRGIAVEVKLFFLTLLCLAFIFIDSNWNVLNPVRRAVSAATYPVQTVVLWPRNFVMDVNEWFEAVELARKQHSHKQQDNIESASLVMKASQLEAENNQLRRLLNVKNSVDIPSQAVEILYVPPHPLNQSIIFTKGEDNGIKPGMPVIDEGGIVGQIRRVNNKTSEALLITNEKVSIPALVQRTGLRVIVFGTDQVNRLEVRYLSMDVDIKPGDKLVTSGIGGYYPAGLSIGEVTSVENNSSQGFVSAIAKPTAHPDRYRHFLVLLTGPDMSPDPDPPQESDSNSAIPPSEAEPTQDQPMPANHHNSSTAKG